MPLAATPVSFPEIIPPPRPASHRVASSRPSPTLTAAVVCRQTGKKEGMALEVLGHAVEYLIDSRMFLTSMPYTRSEEEAVQLLMGCSRRVFEACPEIVPIKTRVIRWVRGLVRRK
jgi:hypothetical protein